MSDVIISETILGSIGDAIRSKNDDVTLYKPSEMPAAIEAIESYPEPTGSVSITENGTANIKDYATAVVNVPNSYDASDEGKVVDNGSLVSQTSQTVTQNGTYDTTTNDEVVVNVAGGGTLVSKTITTNGTYDPADDNADGYSSVTVNVSGGSAPSLPSSVQSDILAIGYGSDLGDWVSNGSYVVPVGNCLFVGNVTDSGSYLSYDLGATDTDITFYFVGIATRISGSYGRIMSSEYSASNQNEPALAVNGTEITGSTYGTTLATGANAFTSAHVCAVSIDVTNQTATYYVDGVRIGTLAVSHNGQIVRVGRRGSNTSPQLSMCIACVALVSGAESESVILENSEHLLSYIQSPIVATLIDKTITANGTYNAQTDDNADGYSEVTVNVSGEEDWTTLTNYIESSGTQYIDTGYIVSDNTIFEVVADVNSSNATWAALFGARAADSNSPSSLRCELFAKANGSSHARTNWGSNDATITESMTSYYGIKSLYTVKKGNAFIDNNSDVVGTIFSSTQSGTDQYSIYIFTTNKTGSDYGSATHCTMKLYRFRIYEGTTLVHEFIPWQDNGVACLKDTVTENLKYNAGTGDFTYGTDS